jgi:hypothetical protein
MRLASLRHGNEVDDMGTQVGARKRHRGAHPEMEIPMLITEFWTKIPRSSTDNCWEWQGYRDDAGYGIFQYGGRLRFAHELSLSFSTGEIKLPNLDTCHSCHNPPCCNPSHLRFDTRKSNVADMLRAGRQNPRRKLSNDDVWQIRSRLAAGARQCDLANQYGVSVSTISMIKSRKRHR